MKGTPVVVELTKVTESATHVDGDDEDAVTALGRMENEPRPRCRNARPLIVTYVLWQRLGNTVLSREGKTMKRAVAVVAMTAGLVLGSAGMASAAGQSENAQIHPGHLGYINSDMKGGGVPSVHFHDVAAYTTGPGGWGGLVSDTAKMYKGIPHAHG